MRILAFQHDQPDGWQSRDGDDDVKHDWEHYRRQFYDYDTSGDQHAGGDENRHVHTYGDGAGEFFVDSDGQYLPHSLGRANDACLHLHRNAIRSFDVRSGSYIQLLRATGFDLCLCLQPDLVCGWGGRYSGFVDDHYPRAE